MSARFLSTKFYRPIWPASGVARSRLLTRLQGGLDKGPHLTLICAPAGSGKTMLLAGWLFEKAEGGGRRAEG